MKRLIVCLLLIGITGCGSDEEKTIAELRKLAVREGIGAWDLDKDIADYTEAIRINPDYALAYYNRATAYQELGDADKAAADFARAKELGYEPPDEDE